MESGLPLIFMNAIIDNPTYAELVVKILPTAIRSEEEYDIMIENIDELISKPEEILSDEEGRLLETLAILVEDYEDKNYPIPDLEPHKTLQVMMTDRGLRQRDLLTVFGSRGTTSEVVRGKRRISKNQAKKLAAFFNVSAEVFI